MPLGKEVGLGPATLCYMVTQWEPSAPPTAAPPHFSAHIYIVAKRSPISATAELLSNKGLEWKAADSRLLEQPHRNARLRIYFT